jgi:hypothetical protein
MQQFFSLLSWRLFTAQYVSGVFPPIIRSSVVLCSWSGRPRTQHDYHHNTKVKPEAETADMEIMMMGNKSPETH